MRVCLLTRPDLFPTQHGAAVKIVRTAEHLSLLGDPVCVVTDDRDAYLRFDAGVAHTVPYPPRARAAQEWPPLPAMGRWAERAVRRLGYPQEEVFLYRALLDGAWWVRALTVGSIEQIDVFQAEFPGYGVPAWVAARILGKKAAVVQHNVEWDRLAEFGHDVRRIRQVEQAVLARVDQVIAVSADDKRRMVAAGTDASKVAVIPHGVDVTTFAQAASRGVRARHGVAPDAPLLFFHGTLHYWPNTEAVRFIAEELLPRLEGRLPGVRVIISGMSPPLYYSHPAIVFTGAVDDLAEHIAAADICLCPIQAGGGTRLKLLEYMAAAKATVSTTKGAEGIPYDSGENIVIADGPRAFAQAVLALAADPARRRALGAAAQRFARRYDWPRVARAYLDVYAGEGVSADWNQRLSASAALTPRASKPLTLLLLINRGCNLRCAFCDLWDRPAQMPLDRVLRLLDQAVEIGTRVLVITGGEPLLHPDLFRVVRAAQDRGLSVNITTNGTLVQRHWGQIRHTGPASWSISIDGLEATHDRLRGRAGAWRQALSAVDRLVGAGIATNVYFTVTRDNVDELIAVYELVRERGAGFDFWPVNGTPELYLATPQHHEAWARALDHIGARDPAVAARRAYYDTGVRYHDGALGPVRCLGLVAQYGVRHDGALLPCCVWGAEDLVVGNVFEHPLPELWASPPVQAARAALETEGCTVGCFNHSLYEYTQTTGRSFQVEPQGPQTG